MDKSWFWLSLISVVGYAVTYVATKPLMGVLPLHVYLLFCSALSFAVFATITLIKGGGAAFVQSVPTLWPWLLLLWAGILVGNVGSSLAIKAANPTSVSLVELSAPLFVALLCWWWLGDAFLTKGVLLGGTLMLAGALVMVLWK
jgi:drug/metabolite transporter (DMT)-like permease